MKANHPINAGATVILLIVAALSEERLKELYDYCDRAWSRSLGGDSQSS